VKNWTPEENKDFRKQLGLYQKELAPMIGVTMRYVSHLERGVKRPVNVLKILLSMLEKQENEKIKENEKHGKRNLQTR